MGKMLRWCLYLITLAATGSAVAITGPQAGVNTDTGERPFRLEFSVFRNSGPPFDLYIQALYYFTQEDQSNELSYFSVAGNCLFDLWLLDERNNTRCLTGIHGYPYRSWDGVDGAFDAGYCTHESILFPTWHRPYLALFEVGHLPRLARSEQAEALTAKSVGLRPEYCDPISRIPEGPICCRSEHPPDSLLGLGTGCSNTGYREQPHGRHQFAGRAM